MKTEQSHTTIAPHGGVLVDRRLPEEEREEAVERASGLKKVRLGSRELSDVELISTGVVSPLEGFMTREDYEGVVENMHLANGVAWPLPITLPVSREEARDLSEGEEIALADREGRVVASMTVEEVFDHDKEREAKEVYKTTDQKHPGVANLFRQGDVLLGGRITLLVEEPTPRPFPEHYHEPAELREIFASRGWKRVVGFQTRNPIHRSHEYIQKSALETVDGLLLSPLVGETRAEDIPADVRMRSYEVLLERYYPKDRTVLAVYPATMRFAGPREALFHAICRQNYGCTHFIIGRSPADPGNYYGIYDAHHIFEEFEEGEIGITPLLFENAFFCLNCGGMATTKTCPHDDESRVMLSGTKVREMLRRGEYPPPEFSRPEVVEVLVEGMNG
nr:sulfate adenylyltransferase [Rubrobacter calidifluminis]